MNRHPLRTTCTLSTDVQTKRLPYARVAMLGFAATVLLSAELSHANDCLGAGDGVANSRYDLDRLIGCFNAQTPAGDHTISLGRDMTLYEGGITPITLDQPHQTLTILGGGAVITSFPDQDAFVVQGKSPVTFINLGIENANRGFLIKAASGAVSIEHTHVSNSEYGVLAQGGQVSFTDSSANDNAQYGLYYSDISVDAETRFIVRDASASNNGIDGINLFSTSTNFSAIIETSRFDDNHEDGIEVFHTSGVTLARNTLEKNAVGIRLENANADILSSSIHHNTTGVRISEPGSRVKLENSELSHNETGIEAIDGYTEIHRSTISFSTVNGLAGSLGTDPNNPTRILLANATVSSNGAGGFGDGIVPGGAKISIAYTLIYNNAGDGVVGDENTAVYSSIITDNDAAGADFSNCAGGGNGLVSLGYNFSGDASCPEFTQSNQLAFGPLKDNGCDTPVGQDGVFCVKTHALSANADAVDSGNCDGTSFADPQIPSVEADQRNASRNTTCDAGPYETGSMPQGFSML